MENEKPLVSVIIPMYNTEEYITECLESVLAQSFKNFEVIVVDDCSTDKSVEIVESYAPKFEERLKLLHTEKNSVCPSLPRNKGLEAATGDYVYFVDSDDALTTDALENLYDTAEKTQADLLICKKYLTSSGVGEDFVKNIVLKGDRNDNNVDLFAESIDLRFKHWVTNSKPYLPVESWVKFIKRDLLIDNKINFLPITQEDSIWTFELFFSAKKIVLVPYLCYVYRKHSDSLVNSKFYNEEFTPDAVRSKFDRIINGLKHVDEFMSGIEFFQKNPERRYSLLELMLSQNIQTLYSNYKNYPPHLIYESFKDAFKDETGNLDVAISVLVSHSIHMINELTRKK